MVPFSVTLLFRVLNFLVLVALGVYVFWRYFYASLKAQMATRQAALVHLNERKNALAQEQALIDQALVEQEKKYESIVQKLQEWRSLVQATLQAREHEREILKEKLVESMRKRRAIMAQEHLEKVVIPQAVHQARAQLQTRYADQKHAESYLTSLFKRMG